MRKAWMIAIVPGTMAMVGGFVLGLLLVKTLWGWTIPDILPGAVEQGLVARSISWFTALKIAIFIAILAGLAGARGGKRD